VCRIPKIEGLNLWIKKRLKMKLWLLLSVVVSGLFFNTAAFACDQTGSCGASCSIGPHFITPNDGDVVSGDINIKMRVYGMKVHPAGDLIKGTGHHHLIIDGASVPEGEAVAKDDTHIHFGKGQTETSITLTPGKHTLTLQFADGHHQSYGKIMSETIAITVK